MPEFLKRSMKITGWIDNDLNLSDRSSLDFAEIEVLIDGQRGLTVVVIVISTEVVVVASVKDHLEVEELFPGEGSDPLILEVTVVPQEKVFVLHIMEL